MTARLYLADRVLRLLVPVALLVGSSVPGTAHNGIALDERDLRSWGVVGLVLLVAQSVPLVSARRVPAAVLAIVGVAFGWFEIGGYRSGFATLGLLVAIYAGARHSRSPRVLAAAGFAGQAVLSVILAVRGAPERTTDYGTFGWCSPAPGWSAGWT